MKNDPPPVPGAARLLIVDDEVEQMKALCVTLRRRGYETAGFTSGPEALAALKTQPFDLLLSDLMMPDMDGIALLQAAQKIEPNLVGIIMTGNGTIDTAVEAMKTGALDYILKPFNLSFILPVLSRALSVRQLRIDNAELTRKVSERTAELEAVNNELEAFSYSVSHDLRAPIRAIDGFSSILLRKFAPEMPAEAQRLLSNVTTSAKEMGQLVDNLLNLSRVSRQELLTGPVNMSALITELVEQFRREHSTRTIDVRIADLPPCVGDRALLKQVFINLLSNAFKFTRQKEPAVIEVGCRPSAEELVYYVKDNGAGFDMDYVKKLFGVFQRLHSVSQYEGTGIGLSIVQRIIHRHGGRAWAEGQVNQGATFYVSLPTAKA